MQAVPGHLLHGVAEAHPGHGLQSEDGHDVGVGELASQLGLDQEASHEVGPLLITRMQHLDRHGATDATVPCAQDAAERAPPDLLDGLEALPGQDIPRPSVPEGAVHGRGLFLVDPAQVQQQGPQGLGLPRPQASHGLSVAPEVHQPQSHSRTPEARLLFHRVHP